MMNEFEMDYRDPLSCAKLATLWRRKPGDKTVLEINVRPVHDPLAGPIKATATLSPDGEEFVVAFETKEGQRSFTQRCDEVKNDMSRAHPKKNW